MRKYHHPAKRGAGQPLRRHSLRLRLISLCLIVPMLFGAIGFLPSSAVTVPTDKSMMTQISGIFQKCLDYDKRNNGPTRTYGFTSFHSLCAHYVNLQLQLMGVNNRYVGGNGNDEYDNYKNLSYSGGGKKIHAYPATKWSIQDALKDIGKQCRVATNILVGFQTTSTAAGQKYGHVMLIHGMIDGYVYFTDNFATTFGGKTYAEGAPVKCSVADFSKFYGRPSVFGFEGIIWFEDEPLTAAVGKGSSEYETEKPAEDTPGPQTPTVYDYKAGVYRVTYSGGLRIRATASTASETLEIIPGNSSICVTEIKNNWGNVFCTLEGKDYNGWVCLDYTERLGDLQAVAAERYNVSGNLSSRVWYNSVDEAIEDSVSGTTFILYRDTELKKSAVLASGLTLKLGKYSVTLASGAVLSIRGGTVLSDTACASLKEDPFVKETADAQKKYTYTCPYSVTVQEAGLKIANGTCAVLSAGGKLPDKTDGISAELICDNFCGTSRTFAAESADKTALTFVTSPISPSRMEDKFSAFVRLSATVNGRTYTLESTPVSFSPCEYAGNVYGKDAALDSVISSMMNLATAAERAAGRDGTANLVLPASARSLRGDDSVLCRAAEITSGKSETTAHIDSVTFSCDEGSVMKFRTDAAKTAGLTLYVYTLDNYRKYGAADTSGKYTAAILTPGADGTFSFDGFGIREYADTFVFVLCETAGSTVRRDSAFAFSVTEYCRRAVLGTADSKILDLSRALCEYSAAVRTYFGYTAKN